MVVKWGIIGCGNVAEFKGGPALYNVANSELIAVMRRDIGKAADFAMRHHAKRYYSKVEELLADEEVNAVYIATPPHVHASQTIKAAEAGKHVLCEKPMAMTVAECEEMIRACRDNGVQLMVAYYRRFFPVVVKMRELLGQGKIGRPVMARTQVSGFYHPPSDGTSPWRIDPKISGGGFLTDVGSHRIDLLTYLLGEFQEVAAFVDTVHFDFEVDDSSLLIMRFENGSQAIASFHWNIGASADEFEIEGTKGRLLSRDLGRGYLELSTDDGLEKYHLPPPGITHLGLVDDFVRSVISGKTNSLSGEEGLKTTKVLEAAYRSSKEGKAVKIF